MPERELYELACPKTFEPVIEQVKTFIHERVEPVQKEFFEAVNRDDIWKLSPKQYEILDRLR